SRGRACGKRTGGRAPDLDAAATRVVARAIPPWRRPWDADRCHPTMGDTSASLRVATPSPAPGALARTPFLDVGEARVTERFVRGESRSPDSSRWTRCSGLAH